MALMKELGKGLYRNFTLKDDTGKDMLAMNVFAMSIKFLKDDMMATVEQRVSSFFRPDEIHWVLTVPAIWSDAAKQFMREAAVKADIPVECLTIALEPEAASLFCRYIPVGRSIDSTTQSLARLPTGSKYLVLDAGGGTIDITIHEVQSEHTLREVRAASGGDWGGRMVNNAFEMFMVSLVGDEVYEQFKETERVDWLDLSREFECRKRESSEGRVTMHFPVSLSDLYLEQNKKSIDEYLKKSVYSASVEVKRGKIKFSGELFQSFFSESEVKIVKHLRFINLADVNTILMVGGYSESTFLQKAIREAFPDKQIVVPMAASSAVLRGALIFGHNPQSITERILKYTYGVYSVVEFDGTIHPRSNLIKSDDGDFLCSGVFSKLAKANETVKTNDKQYTKRYTTMYRNQPCMEFEIYATTQQNPVLVYDEGCSCIGKLNINFDEPDEETGRCVILSMMFGGTEIVVEAEDAKTGKRQIATVDFLG